MQLFDLLLITCLPLTTSFEFQVPVAPHIQDEANFKIRGENPFFYCDASSSSSIILTSLSLSPLPPLAGKPLTLSATASISPQIEDADISISVIYNKFLTLLNQSYKLCETLDVLGLRCPLEGEVSIRKEMQLPMTLPRGRMDVRVEVREGEVLRGCMVGVIDV